MAWEALVETHARHALEFITLLSDHMAFDESTTRYLREMNLPPTMGIAVRTRVLVAVEEGAAVAGPDADSPDGDRWRILRPDRLVRDALRPRRNEESERIVLLAIARAEEGVFLTHIDNALTFVALLDAYLPLDRAVQEYIQALDLTGGRAQSVLQRTMARLAEVHLPVEELHPSAGAPVLETE